MRPLLLAALLPAVAAAQPAAPADSAAAPDSTAAADSTAAPDSTVAADRVLFSFAALSDAARKRQPVPEPEPEPEPEPPAPTLYVLGTAGVSFLAPPGWDGPTSAAETDGYGLYVARNDAPGPLAGTVVRVERIVGLNPLLRERFARGQTAYGTHGATPVGPAAVPRGFGVEVAGPGVAGATAYLERGGAAWTVSVQAPTAVWAAHRPDVLALLSAVDLP